MADHVDKNRAYWNRTADDYQARNRAFIEGDEPAWGVWQIPESQLQLLGEVAGLDVLELGCGAAWWSICLARRGARCTGVDLSEAQLRHGRRNVAEQGVEVTLVEGDAHALAFHAASFDMVFCDHGAMSFADPRVAVPQVARVLRPGGRFVFSMITPILDLCLPDEGKPDGHLLHDYFGMHKVYDVEEACFQLSYGDWIRLFRDSGFVIEDLVELRPEEGASTTYDLVGVEWARRWPAEHVWVVRRS